MAPRADPQPLEQPRSTSGAQALGHKQAALFCRSRGTHISSTPLDTPILLTPLALVLYSTETRAWPSKPTTEALNKGATVEQLHIPGSSEMPVGSERLTITSQQRF